MSTKITLIGAGSVVFANKLMADILQFPELSDCTISLMDIDAQRLKVAELVARKTIAALKIPARVEATMNRREAIRGARYVITMIQVGGYKPATVTDFEIPRKYGLLQTIGDTLGIGGVFRGLRTIPEINKVAQDIADVGAPGCMLLNYSNPMAMNCWAVDRAIGIPHVGLCHSVQGTSKQLAKYAKLPYEDISYLVAGINHMAFFLKFEYKKQDAYPMLFRLLENPNFHADKVRFEMMRRLGYFVTESSEHQSEYVPYFIHHGKEVIEKFSVPIDEYLRRCVSINATWKSTEAELLGKDKDGKVRVPPQSHEYGSYIIHSRETGKARVVYGNVPNRSLITNLPEGCCVEVPCLVDDNGLQPVHIGDLPPQLAAICRTNINVQELTVEAALTRRREYIYQAAMMDPHTATVLTLDKIWKMCDELIAAHQKNGYLGEFAPTIPNTGRPHAGTGDRIIAEVELSEASVAGTSTRMEVLVRVKNPTAKTQKIPLEVCARGDNGRRARAVKLTLTVPARKSAEKRVVLERDSVTMPKGEVLITCSAKNVFAKGARFEPRKELVIRNGTPADFEFELAGENAGKGSLHVDGNKVNLKFKIADSKVETTEGYRRWWLGSSVELFFASSDNSNINHIVCIPDKKLSAPKVLDTRLRDIPGARAVQKITNAGYQLDVSLPKNAVRVDPAGKVFLFDAILSIGALGDAHSGGRTGLNQRLDSNSRTNHYSRVVINK